MAGARHKFTASVVGLLLSSFFSATAAFAATTALGKLVYDLTGSKLDLGLLGLAEFAPAALLVLVAGAVADRYERRRVAQLGMLVEGVAALGLVAYVGSGPSKTLPLFGFVIVFGIGRAFAAPATRSLPADTVDADRLPWVVARYAACWQGAIIVGPVLGGALYVVDRTLPFVAMAILVGAGAVSLALVTPERTASADDLELLSTAGSLPVAAVPEAAAEAEARGSLHDALEGLRFIRGRPILLGAISLDLFAVLFGGAVALLPAIAQDRLHVDAVGLGWLRAAGGIGAAAVTLGLAWAPLARRIGTTLFLVVAIFGVGTIVLGATSSFVVAFVAMAVLSGADAISVFIRATLVPLVTPNDKRGRVLAVENVFIGASNELGAFESGVAGQLLGTTGAVVLGGVATLAVAGVWAVMFPALRDVDGFPEPDRGTSVAMRIEPAAPC